MRSSSLSCSPCSPALLLALFAPRLPQPTHRPNQRAADLEGFLEKNKDKLYDHLKEMMAGCGNPFASALFVQGGSGKKKKGVQTIATKFKSQLKELVDTLEATMPHYVRCVKPNDKKLKFNEGIDACEAAKMRRQLLYAGVMETIAIRKLGYPVREPYPDFWNRCCKMRWSSLVKMGPTSNPRDGTEAVVNAAIEPGLFVMGKTKVFGKGDMLDTIRCAKCFCFVCFSLLLCLCSFFPSFGGGVLAGSVPRSVFLERSKLRGHLSF